MSIWSTLGAVGKKLAPMIPVVGPAIGLGLDIAGSIRGGGGGGDTSTLKSNAAAGQQMSKDLTKSSTGLIESGKEKSGTAGNYFSSVLGNRSQALAAADPEVTTIMDQFDAAHRAAAEFTPRGGGRATLNAQKPYQMAGAIGKLLQGSRSNAASILANLGINEEGLGVQQGGQSISALSGSSAASSDLARLNMAKDEQSGELAGVTGKILGDWLAKRKPKTSSGAPASSDYGEGF